jgi:OFA family oxalate/formate antiporter-like MFS transporter
MALIANLQYSWTLFIDPMHLAHGWTREQISVAFSIFIATETWLTPVAGWYVDRIGPRHGPGIMVLVGGLLVGLGWVINSNADALWFLYTGAAVTGTGAGAVYATCVGNAVKWFPDRRGLAVGLTAAGFGAGAAVTVIPIRLTIASVGYPEAFFWFGIGQGALLLVASLVLRGPPMAVLTGRGAGGGMAHTVYSFTSAEMLRSPIFWLLYVMFVAVAAPGLIATADLAPIAKDFGLSNTAIVLGINTLSFALVVDNVLNGMARPVFGAVSDRFGREKTMAIAFTIGALAWAGLSVAGESPWMFVACAGIIFFTWGEIFSLFPSTCVDTFGPRYATANASLLYTAKGTAAFIVPVADWLKSSLGGWETVFLAAAITNIVVVLLAEFVLRPLRLRQARRSEMLAATRQGLY